MNHIRLLFLLALMLTMQGVQAKVKCPGGRHYIYRYYLCDKKGTAFSLDKPGRWLSRKSVERRQRQGLPLDSTDLPVSAAYLRQMRLKGTTVVGTSRWNNTVIVRSGDTLLLRQLAQLPFVREARMVWQSPDSIEKKNVKWTVKDLYNTWDSVRNDPYGMGRPQVEQLRGEYLHEIGLRGRGMTIAVLDGGFRNANAIAAFKHARLLGARDFVCPATPPDEREQAVQASVFQSITHGTEVLSCMAANVPEVLIGTAPDAAYWLLRCEEHDTEMPVEEDYWAMAAEFADSAGVDLINSSLGYNEYDHGMGTYSLRHLDGKSSLISQTASMLARKGIVLCNSAGNTGMGTWKKITVPADAADILTVGAVDAEGKNAAFSSVGPAQDGRVKPDVMAMGSNVITISGQGQVRRSMGTSFASPILCGMVACLWQGLPDLTALEIMDLVRRHGSQYDTPDNILGYGIPDFWKAYQAGKDMVEKKHNHATR